MFQTWLHPLSVPCVNQSTGSSAHKKLNASSNTSLPFFFGIPDCLETLESIQLGGAHLLSFSCSHDFTFSR